MLITGYFIIGLIVAALWIKNRDLNRWDNFVDWGIAVCLWPIFIFKLFRP